MQGANRLPISSRTNPGIDELDIQACIAYGAEIARERYEAIPLEESVEIKKVRFKLDENLGLRGFVNDIL